MVSWYARKVVILNLRLQLFTDMAALSIHGAIYAPAVTRPDAVAMGVRAAAASPAPAR